MAIEFSAARPPHPRLPGRRRLRAARGRRAARLQRVARPAAAAVVEAVSARPRAALNRYPDPTERAAARRAQRPLRRPGARASRSATARATSCSPPARRCSSPAPSSSTRGRRSASTRTWRPRPARRAIQRAAQRPRTSTTSTRWPREITAATRLVIVCNPNNPTSTALPLARHRGVRRAGPAPRLRDRSTRPTASSTRSTTPTRRSTCSSSTPTSSCCAPSRRSTGCAGCASASRCAARTTFVTAVDQVRQPFFCNAAAQAAAIEALRHQDAVAAARRARDRRPRWRSRTACGELGIELADSQANFCWFDLPGRDGEEPAEVEARVVAGSASAACSCAPATALGRAGRAARDLRHAAAERSASSRAARAAARSSGTGGVRNHAPSATMPRFMSARPTSALDGLRPPALLGCGPPSLTSWRFS